MLLFYKHNSGSSEAMHLCICCHGQRFFQAVFIFCLALDRAALIRVGGWGGFSSHHYPCVSIMVGICSILGLFIFTVCVSNTLAFWKILRTPIYSQGFSFRFSGVRRLPEEAPKLQVDFLTISVQLVSSFPSDLLRGIRFCCRVVEIRPLVCRSYGGVLIVP